MQRPVAFLDLDGVLNHAEWLYDEGNIEKYDDACADKDTPVWLELAACMAPECVLALDLLCNVGNCDLVISAACRDQLTPEEFQRALEHNGAKHCRVVGRTPGIWKGTRELPRRAMEIAMWMVKHIESLEGFPAIILDDMADFGPLTPWLVHFPHPFRTYAPSEAMTRRKAADGLMLLAGSPTLGDCVKQHLHLIPAT